MLSFSSLQMISLMLTSLIHSSLLHISVITVDPAVGKAAGQIHSEPELVMQGTSSHKDVVDKETQPGQSYCRK